MNKKDRIHDWRKIKWPFTATFLYYSLLSLYTGTAEHSEQGFLVMFLTVLIVDATVSFVKLVLTRGASPSRAVNKKVYTLPIESAALLCYAFPASPHFSVRDKKC